MRGKLSEFCKALLAWYAAARRLLPWRVPAGARPDPYHVLVSEAMLQQTQVGTVIAYFERFICALPSIRALAAADEQQVLRLWQGLGYYSRARNLHAAAKRIISDHAGDLPETVEGLLTLPGIGRYTAGAIASLAFGRRAPILDGNVMRVLCRLDAIAEDPRRPQVKQRLWSRALHVLPPEGAGDPGDFNSALMELGATVCTPRAPRCLFCPVQKHCQAFAAGLQEQVPPARSARQRPLERRWAIGIRRRTGQWLIEQRPATGRWASMWQFITIQANGEPTALAISKAAGVAIKSLRPLGRVTHGLTHREYQFDIFTCELSSRARRGGAVSGRRPRAWVTLDQLPAYPLPKPHLTIAAMFQDVSRGE
jgi:A/G-specific adenine glycosylase